MTCRCRADSGGHSREGGIELPTVSNLPPLGGALKLADRETQRCCLLSRLRSCLQLVLRSINSSKSAYASVTYYSRFFESFDVFDRSLLQAGVLMKVGMLYAAILAWPCKRMQAQRCTPLSATASASSTPMLRECGTSDCCSKCSLSSAPKE